MEASSSRLAAGVTAADSDHGALACAGDLLICARSRPYPSSHSRSPASPASPASRSAVHSAAGYDSNTTFGFESDSARQVWKKYFWMASEVASEIAPAAPPALGW